jgi:hypothetical protein
MDEELQEIIIEQINLEYPGHLDDYINHDTMSEFFQEIMARLIGIIDNGDFTLFNNEEFIHNFQLSLNVLQESYDLDEINGIIFEVVGVSSDDANPEEYNTLIDTIKLFFKYMKFYIILRFFQNLDEYIQTALIHKRENPQYFYDIFRRNINHAMNIFNNTHIQHFLNKNAFIKQMYIDDYGINVTNIQLSIIFGYHHLRMTNQELIQDNMEFDYYSNSSSELDDIDTLSSYSFNNSTDDDEEDDAPMGGKKKLSRRKKNLSTTKKKRRKA